ncbi:FAD-dependent oxidoreductase [Oryzihumus sp.]
MRCVVVGAGAWGLPAAAELATRGHEVTLVDRFGVANTLSSSPGPTRLWRLTHPDAVRVRLARRSVEAMERLASRSGTTVFLRRGLLWRDDVSLPAVVGALAAEGVPHEVVAADEVARIVPGLVPDGRDAVWQEEAGPVLAAASMAAQAGLFEAFGGALRVGGTVVSVEPRPAGPRATLDDGTALDADVVVLAPGPGAGELLRGLGVDLPLRPHLEQVVHLGVAADPHAHDEHPCLFDGPRGDEPGLYSMPTPGVGFKVGLDRPLRDWTLADPDRTPDAALTAYTAQRVARTLTAVGREVIDAQVCCWTDSPDGRFVIDTLPGGVVLACGDSGEGFKFSALMGIVLADLAEGRTPDADVASFGLARFTTGVPSGPHVLGR